MIKNNPDNCLFIYIFLINSQTLELIKHKERIIIILKIMEGFINGTA